MKKILSYSYFVRGVQVASSLLVMYIITKYADEGLSTYGKYVLILSSAGFLSSILTARTGEAVTKFYIQYRDIERFNQVNFSIRYGLIGDAIFAALLFSGVYLFSPFISEYILKSNTDTSNIRLFGVIVLLDLLTGTPNSIFQAENRFYTINNIRLLGYCLNIVILLLAFLVVAAPTLQTIIGSLLISSVITIVTLFSAFGHFLFRKNINLVNIKGGGFAREYIAFNLITFTSTFVKAGTKNVDKIMLGIITDAGLVGIYEVLRKAASPISFLTSPLQMIYYPQILSVSVNGKFHELKKMLNLVQQKLTIVSIVYLLLTIFLVEAYIEILGLRWDPLYRYYIALIILTGCFSNQQWWTRSFSNAVNPKLSLYGALVSSFILLTLVLWATKEWLLLGHLVSLLISSLIMMLYWKSLLDKSVSMMSDD